MAAGEGTSLDFFISYTPADELWATWIAWQLESVGYTTRIQAWDFVPGVPFMDDIDRALRETQVVVAVLSRRYLTAEYCRMEWQAALRTDPRMLATVRVEDFSLDGLLAQITYIDLAAVASEEEARTKLLTGLEHTLDGRGKPAQPPGFPPDGARPAGNVTATRRQPRRAPAIPPAYAGRAPASAGPRQAVSVLHVPGPRFGRAADPVGPGALLERIWADVEALVGRGAPRPDAIVISGDLTESARLGEIEEARYFLVGLRDGIGVDPDRLVVVPGPHDVSRAKCRAYFAECEASERPPQAPFYPKYEHYAELFGALYQGLDGQVFDGAQPWTLFEIPDLRIVVAGLNSTMGIDHRPDADHGLVTDAQAKWFDDRLRRYEEWGWLRIGVMRHDPEALRDAAALAGLLGRRLNLLVHGPAAGDRQHEILEVRADGLRRWRPGLDAPESEPRSWHACAGTFAAEESPGPDSPESLPLDPTGRLLERIAEVCRARHDQAKVRPVERLHQLLVTWMERGYVAQRRIGAVIGEPTRADLEAFLASDPEPGSELVYQSPTPASRALRDEAVQRGVRLTSFTEFQGLLDLAGYVTRQTARLRQDRLYSPDLYVPQRFRDLDRADQPVRDDLAAELMRLVAADQGCFALVLGDFGRGKTFVLHEVARRIAEQHSHLVPILIELRALDRAHSVEGLVAAHLANHGEEAIDLRAFRYMLQEGRVVLLFDGFDELVTRVTYEGATEHLHTLLGAATGKAKVILSSRTQYFQSTAQVLNALAQRADLLPQRRILSVEEFSQAQIRSFLVNRYGDAAATDSRLSLIGGIQDLLGLSSNPRMLSFISDLDEARLLAVARAGSPVSAAGLYREILNAWLAHEATRARGEKGALAGLTVDALWRAVSVLALRLWAAGEPMLVLADLSDIARTLTGLSEVPLSAEQTAHAMGAGSLLVRTDDGAFGFIHDSVGEWLVAAEIARGLTNDPPENPVQLAQRMLSALTVEFLCDLAGVQACERWTRWVESGLARSEIVWTNAMRITGRLKTALTADLRGASLQGQDLSGRSFHGVDFTGADLSEAQLVSTDLSGAVLRDARLVGARLDDATLAGADLTNADFTRARLGRTNLTNATFTGSRWNLASLIHTSGLPGESELRGAAIVPGHELVTVFAPAEISVRHGFHPGLGRLPRSIAYSHDGGTLAIGSDDGGVLVCETANGRPVRNLQGHRGRVFAVTYSPDELVLVTGSADGDVRIWDAASGRCLHVLEGHAEWAWPVVIDPTGQVVASGDRTGLLRLWSTRTGQLLMQLPHEQDIVYTAAFHPVGRYLAAGYHDGVVRMWDTSTGENVGVLHGETGSVFRVTFDPSGTILAIAEADGSLRLWDSQLERQLRRLVGHTGSVYAQAFHPRLPLLASGDTHGAVRMWDIETGKCTAELSGHEQPVYWVEFNPDGDLLASGDGAGAVRLWDAASGSLRHSLTGHSGSVWPFVFRPDGAQLAISDDQLTVRLWDPVTGRTQHRLTGHGRQVTSVSFNADGKSLATSGNDGVVRLWNPRTGQLQQTLFGAEDRFVTLQSAAFDPAGRVLATVSNDGRVNLRNLETGEERRLSVESPSVWALAFSPTGDSLATANDDDTVRLWWRHNGRLMHVLGDHGERVRSIAFHPRDPVVATGCGDHEVRLWSTETGALLKTLHGHADRVYAVSYSGDGTLLASASWDGTVRVWSSEGELVRVLRGHAGRLYTAAFAPTGSVLASAGDDLVIRLWDAASGEHLHMLVGHSRRVWSLAFSPADPMLASAGDDGTARLWSLGADPGLELTLIGGRNGWAAIALDGRFKVSGDVSGQFWHAIGMCRFDPGELDEFVDFVRHLPLDAEF
jgi:WD40 repeat protein